MDFHSSVLLVTYIREKNRICQLAEVLTRKESLLED